MRRFCVIGMVSPEYKSSGECRGRGVRETRPPAHVDGEGLPEAAAAAPRRPRPARPSPSAAGRVGRASSPTPLPSAVARGGASRVDAAPSPASRGRPAVRLGRSRAPFPHPTSHIPHPCRCRPCRRALSQNPRTPQFHHLSYCLWRGVCGGEVADRRKMRCLYAMSMVPGMSDVHPSIPKWRMASSIIGRCLSGHGNTRRFGSARR